MRKWLVDAIKKPLLAAVIGVVIAVFLSGCKKSTSTSPELSFKSISQGKKLSSESGYGYDKEEPGIAVITNTGEVENPGADVQFSADLVDMLRAVDYKKNFVIIVLHGLVGATSPKFTMDILQVLREEDTVTVQAHFNEPGPGDVLQQAFSSPYHIIRVTKKGVWGREIQFVLQVDGKDVVHTTHFVP